MPAPADFPRFMPMLKPWASLATRIARIAAAVNDAFKEVSAAQQAAMALGMSRTQALRRVLIPQALRRVTLANVI